MTAKPDPVAELERIARELDGDGAGWHPEADRIDAWIARYGPFVRAAMEYCAWADTSSRRIAEVDTSKTFAWINRLGELSVEMRSTYRAAVAKEAR